MTAPRLPGLIAFALLVIVADVASAQCSARELKAKYTDTIELDAIRNGVRQAPAFYLHRDAPNELVFFFRPDDVVALFELLIRQERERTPQLTHSETQDRLDRIRRDLPLAEDTDLLKYGLRDWPFYVEIHSIAATLLQQGHVAVDFIPLHAFGGPVATNDSKDPTTIKLVWWDRGGSTGRKFCTLQGDEILSVRSDIQE